MTTPPLLDDDKYNVKLNNHLSSSDDAPTLVVKDPALPLSPKLMSTITDPSAPDYEISVLI